MKKIGFISLLVLMLTSCLNDFLDVQPVSDISTNKFWKTDNDVRAGLNSAYAALQQTYNKNTGANYMTWFEVLSVNFIGSTASSNNQPNAPINTNNLNSSYLSSDWNEWYKVISIANYGLHFIPGVQDVTDKVRNNYLAEAYFLRAFSYFNLARIWCNVPLVTKPVLSLYDVDKPKQASQADVLKLVGEDLKEAVRLVDTGAGDVFRFNAGALYMLYTDYAMWMHDYEVAELYSRLLMELKKYKLVEGVNFATVCSNAETTENIWTMKWSYENNSYVQFIYQMHVVSGTQMIPSLRVKELWETPEYRKDYRRYQTIDSTVVYSSNHVERFNGRAAIWKWCPGGRMKQSDVKYFPLYRYADVLLLRAEALNQLNDYEGAVALLNQIRKRAGITEKEMSEFDMATDKKTAIEDAILQERQLELLGEGKRWFDLIRTGRAMTVMNDFFENYIRQYSNFNCQTFAEEWQLYWPVYHNNLMENENLTQFGKY